jgi:hypothetical protein
MNSSLPGQNNFYTNGGQEGLDFSGIVTKKDLIRERSLTAGNRLRKKAGAGPSPYSYVAKSKAVGLRQPQRASSS